MKVFSFFPFAFIHSSFETNKNKMSVILFVFQRVCVCVHSFQFFFFYEKLYPFSMDFCSGNGNVIKSIRNRILIRFRVDLQQDDITIDDAQVYTSTFSSFFFFLLPTGRIFSKLPKLEQDNQEEEEEEAEEEVVKDDLKDNSVTVTSFSFAWQETEKVIQL